MLKADVLREALRAKRRQQAEEATRAEESRNAARQTVYDLFYLGLTYSEIVQKSGLSAKLLYDFFIELKLPLAGVKEALRAFNDQSFLRTHSEFVAVNGSSKQTELAPRVKRARFGENRWSNSVVVSLSESESDASEDSPEGPPALAAGVPVEVPTEVSREVSESVQSDLSMEPVQSGESAEAEAEQSTDQSQDPPLDEENAQEETTETDGEKLTAEQEIELLEHQIRTMKARADLEEQLKTRRSERDSIGIRKSALVRKIKALKLTQHRQRIRQIASELAAQQKILAAAEKQNQRLADEMAAETAREHKLTTEINLVLRQMDPTHHVDDDEVMVIESSGPAVEKTSAVEKPKLLDATYRSPLRIFNSHRYSPLADLFSPRYNGQFVDVGDRVFCRKEGSSSGCTDPNCVYVHARDFAVPAMTVLKALSSAVVGDPAVFKQGMAERVRAIEKEGKGFDPKSVAAVLLAYRQELSPAFLDLPVP